MEEKLVNILNEMAEYLSVAQMKKLQEVLLKQLAENCSQRETTSNIEYLKMFLNAKKIEGCSERTLQYYRVTVEHLLKNVTTQIRKITTDELRNYLVEYQKMNNCSKVTVDNIRRNISSFFSWLEEEDYVLKSPMRRIHKIKTKTVVKEVISDEAIERMRDRCKEKRDIAIIDLLYSTGIRVGELINLDIGDLDLEQRECVVYGKGDKERRVYFDAKAKIHLQEYIHSRTDNNPALFVTLDAPHTRLKISGVEIRLRELGRALGLAKKHPHKFRRTMATRAIDKGMPIEQVQKILGHSQIDTTMQYAIVNQINVKTSHQKLPYKIINDYPIEGGERRSKSVDLAVVSIDVNDFDVLNGKAKAELVVEFKYEPSKMRKNEIGIHKLPVVSWQGVLEDIDRVHRFVSNEKSKRSIAILIDEFGRFMTPNHIVYGSEWIEWKNCNSKEFKISILYTEVK